VAVAQQPPDGLKALEAAWRYVMDVTPRDMPDDVRFATATAAVEERIRGGSDEELAYRTERILVADTVEALFR
jgi:hypothetical protein